MDIFFFTFRDFDFILAFRFSQVKILTSIGGTKGKADGLKIIESVVHSIIEPTFLPSISWSGRGKEMGEKIALSKYLKIVNLISLVMNKADKKFNQMETTKALKYKIIKHAPAKYGTKNDKKEAEVLISVKSSIVPETAQNE